MPSSTGAALTFGDIVLVPFPFTNQTATKRRPAVVVSSRDYAQHRLDVVLMAVTSQMQPLPAFADVWLQDWQGAGLLKPSAVKPVHATMEQRLIIRVLGSLSPRDKDGVHEALALILGQA